MKSNYKKIILDFIPAFLGVLIALMLSNWSEQRKENQFIKKSIVSIYNDNKTNLENINTQIIHLENQLDTITYYLNNDTLNVVDLIKKNKGLRTKFLYQSGWNILGNSELVTKIDYDLLTSLSTFSESINFTNSIRNSFMEILYNKPESKSITDKYQLFIRISDFKNTFISIKKNSEEIDSILITKYKRILNP